MSDRQDDKTAGPTFINANRRGFLQGAAVASGVAATGVAAASHTNHDHDDQTAPATHTHGYELNDYVKKYYKRVRS